MNLSAYAPNPIEWVDPLGLWKGQPRQAGGRFGAGKDPSKPCPCESDGTHGNSHNSTKPAIGYTLRHRKSGEVMKYGETTMGKKRYTQKYLDDNGVEMQEEVSGSKKEMHSWQHKKSLSIRPQMVARGRH
ncbi:hypothetical protein HU763_008870 [Pseudomonas anuradhapurensis]|nr:hypothetical protein HU763_008870 [Pseudomonas anuradhapurensis]